MHGQAMKLFLDYMTADWEYEHRGHKYDDAHEMIAHFLHSNKQYYIENYNTPLYDEYDEGYDSWG